MADVTSTLNSWSSTAASNLPANSASVGPNTLADNQRTIQAVVRAALAGDGTIASATTTDLSTVNDGDITVTGTTTITGFGTLTAGIKKVLTFSGALTLTHNATSLILPGAANITTAAGDVAIMRSLGSGNWKCISFTRAASLPTTSADIQVQLATAFTTGGTSTAFTLTPTPAITANVANQRFRVKFHAAAGATPTLAVSGLTALNLKYKDSTGTKKAITATQVPINWISDVENDGTDWVVQSVAAQTKPAFSVHKNSTNQTGVVTATPTLVTWSTEEFDTNANFASNRFTPTVAGIYQLNASVFWVTAVSGDTYDILIYKNGTSHKSVRKNSSSTVPSSVSISAQVQANGTTDYFEIYVQQQSGANKDISGDTAYTYFNGCML